MSAVFDQWGVRFEYPENWSFEGADAGGEPLTVTIASPGGAFWALNIYESPVELSALIEEVVEAMRTEYPSLEVEESADEVEGVLMQGCELSFFYLDLCSTAFVRGFHAGGNTFLIVCQAEDREMKAVEAVFRAVTTSLVRSAIDEPRI